MPGYFLKKEQLIPRPLSEVFPFFQNPENLAVITPRWLDFKVVTKPPIIMRSGLEIDYTIRALGLPMKWTSRITTYEPPHRFVDEQLRGPYTHWHHTHYFQETPQGTLMIDEVRYGIPGWFLGSLAHFLFVKKDLDRIFQFRSEMVRKIFNF